MEVEGGTEAAEGAGGPEAAQVVDVQDVATLEEDPWLEVEAILEEVEATMMKMVTLAVVPLVEAEAIVVEDLAVTTTAAAEMEQTRAAGLEVPVERMILELPMQPVAAETRKLPLTTLEVLEPLDPGTPVVEVGGGVPFVDANSTAKRREARRQRPPSWASCRPTCATTRTSSRWSPPSVARARGNSSWRRRYTRVFRTTIEAAMVASKLNY